MTYLLKFTALLTVLLLLLLSCDSSQNKNKLTQLLPLTILDLGLKSFPLDEETAVDFNSRFKVNVFDGREYLSFANRPTSRIYEFDYETGEATRKILLEKEGPNAVYLWWNIGMFFHSKDSIFLDSGGFGYYLLNGNGEVLQKFGQPEKEGTLNPECCPIAFTNAAFYQNGIVYGEQSLIPSEDQDYFEYTMGSYDLKSDAKTREQLKKSSFIPQHREIIEMERSEDPMVSPFSPNFYSSGGLLYAASPVSDTVHVFKDFELIARYYASNSNVQLADYQSFLLINQRKQIDIGLQNVTEVNQPPHYVGVLVSPDGNIIYRILIEETKGKLLENSNQEIPEITKASLVVFNKKTNQLGSYDLPVNELEIPTSIVSRSVFTSSAGIHFQTKEQENEDRLDFRVFGMKK